MEIRKNGFLSTQTSYPSDCSCDFHVGSGSGMSEKKMRKLSPLECMKYTEAVTYHKSRKKPKIKKFRCWGKHPEIYLAKKYLFRNKNIWDNKFVIMAWVRIGIMFCGNCEWSGFTELL